MGGEVVHGILGSNILKYMENWKNLSLLVLILNSIFNDANKTTLTVSSIYVFRICLHREQRAQIVMTRVKPRTEIAGDTAGSGQREPPDLCSKWGEFNFTDRLPKKLKSPPPHLKHKSGGEGKIFKKSANFFLVPKYDK